MPSVFTEKDSTSHKGFKVYHERYCEPVALEEKWKLIIFKIWVLFPLTYLIIILISIWHFQFQLEVTESMKDFWQIQVQIKKKKNNASYFTSIKKLAKWINFLCNHMLDISTHLFIKWVCIYIVTLYFTLQPYYTILFSIKGD